MNKIYYISVCFLCITGLSVGQNSDSLILNLKSFKNLYQVNDSIFRSEQPNKKEFIVLEQAGFKTVINFRRLKNDSSKAKGTSLELVDLPMQTKRIVEAEIIEALKAIKHAEKPILIHCWHGSDRTGVVTAAYRIVFENWSKESAIAEFRKKEFGYHENWYPHLVNILKNLNTEKIKQQLKLD